MAKRKVGERDLHALDGKLVDRRATITPNCAVVTESSLVELRPYGAKSSKVEHLNMKITEHALCASAKTTITFAATTMRKAQQNCTPKCFEFLHVRG